MRLHAFANLPMLLCAVTQTPLPKMQLDLQSLDGDPQDICGPSDVTSLDPFLERVWGAQGRRRASWRVSDRSRILGEEDLGYDYDTGLRDLAVDYDPTTPQNHRLFTLTLRQVQQLESGPLIFPAKITVDRITNPQAPLTLQTFQFAPNETPLSIATSPDQNKLVVIVGVDLDTNPSYELRIYDYSSGFVINETQPPAIESMPTGSTSCGASFKSLIHAQVERIVVQTQPTLLERTVALVTATVADSGCSPLKPQPTALLICDIDDPTNPEFYDANLSKQAWQPCRQPPVSCEDARVNGFAHVRAGNTSLVYAVGGKEVQMRELDVSNVSVPSTGIVPTVKRHVPLRVNATRSLTSVQLH